MKQGIHPETYRLVAFKDMSNEDVFITRSCVNTKETNLSKVLSNVLPVTTMESLARNAQGYCTNELATVSRSSYCEPKGN